MQILTRLGFNMQVSHTLISIVPLSIRIEEAPIAPPVAATIADGPRLTSPIITQ